MNNDNFYTIKPIAYIKTDFKEKFGIPRQSGKAKSSMGRIVFYPEFRNPDALKEIDGFSHLWLIFDFSLSHTEKWQPMVRPPRLGGNKKVGVFASRSPFRPNSLGLSSVKLEKIEKTANGIQLIVSGVDLLDNTPIFDIKPYLTFTDCHPKAKCGYAEKEKSHKLKVLIPKELKSLLSNEKLKTLTEILKEDPRPSYQEDGKIYGLKFYDFNVKFLVKNNVVTVIKIG